MDAARAAAISFPDDNPQHRRGQRWLIDEPDPPDKSDATRHPEGTGTRPKQVSDNDNAASFKTPKPRNQAFRPSAHAPRGSRRPRSRP